MPKAEAGEDLPAGGQSQEPQDAEHRTRLDREFAQGASGPAQTEGHEPRKQWMPASATPGPSVLTGSKGRVSGSRLDPSKRAHLAY